MSSNAPKSKGEATAKTKLADNNLCATSEALGDLFRRPISHLSRTEPRSAQSLVTIGVEEDLAGD
jgi:hypothetical protein